MGSAVGEREKLVEARGAKAQCGGADLPKTKTSPLTSGVSWASQAITDCLAEHHSLRT